VGLHTFDEEHAFHVLEDNQNLATRVTLFKVGGSPTVHLDNVHFTSDKTHFDFKLFQVSNFIFKIEKSKYYAYLTMVDFITFKHFNKTKSIGLHEQVHYPRFKPEGAWFAPGHEWISLCHHNKIGKEYKYKHNLLSLDLTNIIQIRTIQDFNDLRDIYPVGHRHTYVDWAKVARDFSGIYFAYDDIKAEYKALEETCDPTIRSLDIESLVIWHPSFVTTKFAKFNMGAYCKYAYANTVSSKENIETTWSGRVGCAT